MTWKFSGKAVFLIGPGVDYQPAPVFAENANLSRNMG